VARIETVSPRVVEEGPRRLHITGCSGMLLDDPEVLECDVPVVLSIQIPRSSSNLVDHSIQVRKLDQPCSPDASCDTMYHVCQPVFSRHAIAVWILEVGCRIRCTVPYSVVLVIQPIACTVLGSTTSTAAILPCVYCTGCLLSPLLHAFQPLDDGTTGVRHTSVTL
jgi:hypothetical protein